MGQALNKKRNASVPFWFENKCDDGELGEKKITGSTAAVGSTEAVGSTVLKFVTCRIDLTALSWSITSCGGGRGLLHEPPTGSLLQGASVWCSEILKPTLNINLKTATPGLTWQDFG